MFAKLFTTPEPQDSISEFVRKLVSIHETVDEEQVKNHCDEASEQFRKKLGWASLDTDARLEMQERVQIECLASAGLAPQIQRSASLYGVSITKLNGSEPASLDLRSAKTTDFTSLLERGRAKLTQGRMFAYRGCLSAALKEFRGATTLISISAGISAPETKEAVQLQFLVALKMRKIFTLEALAFRYANFVTDRSWWTKDLVSASNSFLNDQQESYENKAPSLTVALQQAISLSKELTSTSAIKPSNSLLSSHHWPKESASSLARKTQSWEVKANLLPHAAQCLVRERILSFSGESDAERGVTERWLNSVLSLPFTESISQEISLEDRKERLLKAQRELDAKVVGHGDAKELVLDLLNTALSNKGIAGPIIGLVGPSGIGKTTLVSAGFAAALSRPIISEYIGGATSSGYIFGLENGIVQCGPGSLFTKYVKCAANNPIFVFEEIDKIARTPQGEAVSSKLMRFIDKLREGYLVDDFIGEIPLKCASSLIVLTYNDEQALPSALHDRISKIEMQALTDFEKESIWRNHLLPQALLNAGLGATDLLISTPAMTRMVKCFAQDKGARGGGHWLDRLALKASRCVTMGDLKLPLTLQCDENSKFLLSSVDQEEQ